MSTATIPAVASVSDPPGERARSILFQDQIEIPLGIASLEDFRAWARSDDFPEQGRIDYIDGRIEVDLMVENLFYHGACKTEVARVLANRIADQKTGRLFIDATRVSHPQAKLSAEPDLVYLSFESLRTQRVALVRATGSDPDSFVEIEGTPDFVCELVSDGSARKDNVRLAKAYFRAGVQEYWLVDARGVTLSFQILRHGPKSFEATEPDGDGYQTSSVFGCRYLFTRDRGPDGHWTYSLDERPLA